MSGNAGDALARSPAWERLLRRLPGYRGYTLYARAVSAGPIIPEAQLRIMERVGQGITFEQLNPSNPDTIEEYVRYRSRPKMTADGVMTRLAMGRVALLARAGGRIIGDVWAAEANYPLPARDGRLERMMREAGYVYTYLAYVAPEARARGAFPLLLQRQFEMAVQSGKRGLFGSVLPISDASRGSLVRTGFRPFGNLSVVQVGSRYFGRFRLTAELD
jgi:hypothetical protein